MKQNTLAYPCTGSVISRRVVSSFNSGGSLLDKQLYYVEEDSRTMKKNTTSSPQILTAAHCALAKADGYRL